MLRYPRSVATDTRFAGLEAGGGCAAKYSAARLRELLAGFAPVASDDLLVGLAPADDAAVYRLSDEQALIVTTDFFPPMVDEPATFGAIAAANALNDIFAMGGRPLLALSIAGFPETLELEAPRAVLDAAARTVQEAGAVLAGGHTIRTEQPLFGLAAVGTVHPEALWRKNAATPGDVVYVTKPLGTGLVLTAVRKGILGEAEYDAAVASMTALNAASADAIRPFEPHAVTDVTGFGLLGHAWEVAERSGVRIVLEAGALPALPGAVQAAEAGVRTGGDPRNREFAGPHLELEQIPEALDALGFDPQTAGGLLVSVPAERGATLEAEFTARRLFVRRIGFVEEGSGVVVQ